MSYTPPFTVSAKAINLIAEISAMMERFAVRMEQSDALRLRKANRIKTIHSSLAIEGNTLTEGQVTDILEGKTVVAPPRQIQEVKNAIAAYELYPSLNPFEVKDLLRAHGAMMLALTDDAGQFCGRLNPLFVHLQVENMVYSNQQEYYDAIAASTAAGESGAFIDFMLGEIKKSLARQINKN